MPRWLLSATLLILCSASPAASTHRLQDGLTAFVNNPDGKEFTVKLTVRDLNLFETGPRELLVKVQDPDGKPVVRKVIPDDGVTSKAFLPPLGAWDHEAWYYSYVRSKGTQPMIRWSAFSAPDRLASIAKRDFSFPVKPGRKGVYRILIVGCIDHYVTLDLAPGLPYAVAGQPDWIHGHGKQWSKSFVYVPRGSIGLFAAFAEYDKPRRRQLTIRDPEGKVLLTHNPGSIFWKDPHWQIETTGAFAWKGLPGPDFTTSVNGANEWFAARRKSYYALTYHGRLSPKWESNAHPGQSGYGGGTLCQLHVPGKGLVLASTLNGSYGEDMDPSEWRKFRLHTLAGLQADGSPFVAGDSEHEDAKLEKGKVTSSGEIRNSSLRCKRTFSFEADHVACSVQLDATADSELLELWLKNRFRGKVLEAYEMIPYLPKQRTKPAATLVTVIDKGGKELKPLGKDAVEAAGVKIDRGGFGVRIEFDKPRTVLLGQSAVVMVRLANKVTEAKEVSLASRLVPLGK